MEHLISLQRKVIWSTKMADILNYACRFAPSIEQTSAKYEDHYTMLQI